VTDKRTFVIVGAGLAGAKAAATLRSDGFDGDVLLLGAERHSPYERPPLSKGYLRGEVDLGKLFVEPSAFYEEKAIELRAASPVDSIDRGRREVVLENRERVRYDQLLLAPGAEPRRLDGPGAGLDGIFYLRDLGDADRLRAALAAATTVVVVGGGWIGAEVAASARELGHHVTMVHPDPAPLQKVLGPEVAAVYQSLHADHGVAMRMSTRVESFRGASVVEEVVTDHGDRLAADLVVVGVGATPRTKLAVGAGLEVDDGIVVDELLRTHDKRIYAAGDAASAWHPLLGRRLRVEHWSNALNQGPAAARNMLGPTAPYDRLPYFFSDQYDVGMEYLGHAPDWDRVVFRGDPAAREFVAFWVKDDRVAAAMNVNVWGVTEPLRHLITSMQPVDDEQLRDPSVPLDQLVPDLVLHSPTPGGTT
jgi:3-phenylpropionate/trans-cinnamate dioxygenase ferredoxin reductase subunit